MTTQPSTDISNEKIIDLVEKHNLSLYEIFEKTDYTPEKAYPEVVALILSLSIALQIATAYGRSNHVGGIKDKIIEIYADWIELSNGKFPISKIEENPEAFQKAIVELKSRVSKRHR